MGKIGALGAKIWVTKKLNEGVVARVVARGGLRFSYFF